MEAKEKALELVVDYYSISSEYVDYGIDWEMAKECATISVDEILKLLKYEGILIGSYYWENVKQEINKL